MGHIPVAPNFGGIFTLIFIFTSKSQKPAFWDNHPLEIYGDRLYPLDSDHAECSTKLRRDVNDTTQ